MASMNKRHSGWIAVSLLILLWAAVLPQLNAAGSLWNDDFNDGDLAGWTPNGGAWSNSGGAARVVSGGDAWNIRDAAASDFTYGGDLTLENGNAVGLSFRTNRDGSQGYDAILDRVDGRLKLCKRPYQVLASYYCPVNQNRVYRLQIIAQGANIRVYLDGTERINVNDPSYSGGRFGMFAYAATARFDNLTVSAGSGSNSGSILDDFSDGDLAGWTPNGGAWSISGGAARVVSTGDAWNIHDAAASDFTYGGDLTLENGNAVGLSFRANRDGSQGYDAILDRVDGRLKLCKRPYQVLASYNCQVNQNQVYRMQIVARGANIRVLMDGTERINVNDSSYSGGRFGMFAYAATARFDNLTLR